jgi:uncharacterized membrane protein YecN with MAPEG domain
MPPSHWSLVGFVVWTLLLLMVTVGAPRISAVVTKRAKANSFNPAVPHGSERYQRSMRAHLNCVENLPIFAALVLLGAELQLTAGLFQTAAAAVLPARMLQSAVHVASGRNRAVLVRFVAFSLQWLCFMLMACLLAARGLEQP